MCPLLECENLHKPFFVPAKIEYFDYKDYLNYNCHALEFYFDIISCKNQSIQVYSKFQIKTKFFTTSTKLYEKIWQNY